jgi:hypothetical protein
LRTVGALLVVLLFGGCGGGGGTADPEKVDQTPDLAQYDVRSEGFSVGVPPAWVALNADELPTQEEIADVLGDNPEMRPYLEAMAEEDSLVKFMALDPGSDPELTTNLNVGVESPSAEVTREQYFEAMQAQVAQVFSADIDSDRVSLPAGQAVRLTYEHSAAGFPVAVLQYFLLEDGKGYALTFTTHPDELDRRTAEFKRSARSFTID